MAEGLQFKETLEIISGGFDGEIHGSDGLNQNWTDTTGTSGSDSVTYYYRDSRTGQNQNSTEVRITILDAWTATRDENNFYTITVNTTVTAFTRTKIGNPLPSTWTMFIKREPNGAILWSSGGCVNGAINATYGTPINLGSYTFVLPPGQSSHLGTIYFRNNYCGMDNVPPPNIYVDEMAMGLSFKNNLPPDYRPGKIMDNGNTWQSHNRTGGADNVWNGSSWQTMRTDNGPTGQGNPPYMRHQSDWRNQRKIGANS